MRREEAEADGRAAEGIVRPARRPHGWVAPGPASAAREDERTRPGPNEDRCWLTGDWRILQRVDGHRWSLDDLLTAWQAIDTAPAEPASFLDLGCGIGSVLLMLAWAFPAARGVGVEAQALSSGMARRSVWFNGADDRVEVVDGDLRALAGERWGGFEVVTGTPPYFDPQRATRSSAPQRGPCRFELRGGVEAYVEAAVRCAHEDGRITLCGAASQRARIETEAARHGWRAARVQRVVPRLGKEELLVVVTLARGAGRTDERVGTVRDDAGQWTPWFLSVRARMGMPPRPDR